MLLAPLDRAVAALLAATVGSTTTDLPELARARPGEVLRRAEAHGVGDVVWSELRARGTVVDRSTETSQEARALARELDLAAHLSVLAEVDGAFASRGLRPVVLKGPLFALRYYPRPSARATSDVDLLVAERELHVATEALATIGYTSPDDAREARYRREHHHLHFFRPGGLPLELHFHAYRGFGRTLRGEPILARAVPSPLPFHAALRVASRDDELVYLAVHAAAHRFVRLGWLFDLALLVASASPVELAAAADRARAWGFGRPLALAADLLTSHLGVAPDLLRPLGGLGPVRRVVLDRVTSEPASRVMGSATRLVYTTLLCESSAAAARYASSAAYGHLRRLAGGRVE